MQDLIRTARTAVKQAIDTLQQQTSNANSSTGGKPTTSITASDIFYAVYCVAFLPGCPTAGTAAVGTVNQKWVADTIVNDIFPRNFADSKSSASSTPLLVSTTPSLSSSSLGASSSSQQHHRAIINLNVITALAAEQPSPVHCDGVLSDWSDLLTKLVFARIVELHLAMSDPSPFSNKKSWYTAARGMSGATEGCLTAAASLVKKSLASARPGMANAVLAAAAAVVMRAIHTEHILERLREADPFLSRSVKPLEVSARYARDMFSACNATRSIDAMAQHCPFFVVIAAAAMEKLPPVQQREKDRREEQFAERFPLIKAAEDQQQQQQQTMFRLSPQRRAAGQPQQPPQQQQQPSPPMHAAGLQTLGVATAASSPSGAPAALSSVQNAAPEQIVDWTNYMLRHPRDEVGGGNVSGGAGAVMGEIPPGILAAWPRQDPDRDGDGGDDGGSSSTSAPPPPAAPVRAFCEIFVAGRLALTQVGNSMAGSAGNAWANASRAFSTCEADCAAPFAEMATVARLRMGDTPLANAFGGGASDEAGGNNNNNEQNDDDATKHANPLHSLGATVLSDVALALRCGHLAAFDAAVSDAARELAARGLLSAVMMLRTHAAMLLVKKYLHSNSEAREARRLDVEDFFKRYRNGSQLPQSLLDTEVQLIVPLILGQRLKARLEHQTLVMAPDAFVFDN